MDKSSRLTNDLLITQYLPRSTYRRLRVQILLKTRWVSVFSYQKGKERKSLEPTETISPQGPGYKQNKRKYTQAEVYLEYSTMQQFGIWTFSRCIVCVYMLTLIAIFLSLCIAENCFKRLKTAGSRGLSGAEPSTFIHGWPARKHIIMFSWHRLNQMWNESYEYMTYNSGGH